MSSWKRRSNSPKARKKTKRYASKDYINNIDEFRINETVSIRLVEKSAQKDRLWAQLHNDARTGAEEAQGHARKIGQGQAEDQDPAHHLAEEVAKNYGAESDRRRTTSQQQGQQQ